jgi:hypothetical protein
MSPSRVRSCNAFRVSGRRKVVRFAIFFCVLRPIFLQKNGKDSAPELPVGTLEGRLTGIVSTLSV